MPHYQYTGTTGYKKQISGEINASNRNDAIQKLRKKKIRVISIKAKQFKLDWEEINLIFANVTIKDLSRFTRELSAMTSAGLPLIQCMDTLASQTENKLIATAVKQISLDIQAGNSLAEAMQKHPKIFNALYCDMVAAGETSGDLDGVLTRLAEYQEKTYALIRKVKGAMTYPLILILVTIAATALMLTFVIPKFAEMFDSFGGELPAPTRFVMSLSNFIQNYILYIIGGAIAAFFALRAYYKTDQGSYVIDNIKLKLPILGELFRKSSISRFSQTLSTLLTSGIGIIEALSITAKTAGNTVMEKGILRTIEQISAGQTIAEPLQETGIFPPMVTHMISIGEKTGDISNMLTKISQFYEEEVDAAVDALTSILEPIMVVVMGVLIGGMLIAMYLPMFDVINQVG